MASKSNRPAKYDLKAAEGKRDLFVKIGLTALVVVFAVGLVGYILMSGEKSKNAGDLVAVRAAAENVITNEQGEPKAVLSLYEDFHCPHCAEFEEAFGGTLSRIIDSGAAAIDYYSVSIMDDASKFSTRSANAAYCVGAEDTSVNKEAFRRFHSGVFAKVRTEGSQVLDDKGLTELARQSGVVGKVPECIRAGRNNDMVQGLSKAAGISGTPTVRLNGEDISFADKQGNFISTDEFIAKITDVVGDVPGLKAATKNTP